MHAPYMTTDLLIAGAGLSGSLIALAVAKARPEIRVTLVEGGARIGGNHVWSFFDSDVAGAGADLLAPLVCHHWSGHDVAFPAFRRTLDGGYNAIESERLDAVVRAALPADRILTGVDITTLDRDGATFANGRRIAASGVIDTRGFTGGDALQLGWQKFAGRVLRLARPHGIDRPIIMDATVDQSDGYRFVYLLPFGPDRIFVEDTYYTPEPDLDVAALERRILGYATARGWYVEAVERAEAAALPIAMGGDIDRILAGDVAKAGMAAALFHPMTGYSLPDAVQTALLVAGQRDLSSAALRTILVAHARQTWRARRFYRLLAAMLFRAADAPETRYRTFERFYGLGEDLIARFYAARSTPLDKARILMGKPPVPIGRAMGVMMQGGWR
ncbi:lycopene beta-cyclase CrtY [Sphingomonas nostoxanthinifaciens]|uniref:lycopene beta-cyclase CrtY n=1 Tax=Sphingomonas nostoxanthinifaciens TaxID=2872652 RepID=UPI001CC1E536|nr:lycopene beta-cyclase CrtY [Sphingomonas nostoxanthinifaciens]UAK24100.1 lycopene beta-cyclase CrtY [Sphingomonas nostoxanthinifaciens]